MHHSFFENGASINGNSESFLTCNIIYNKIRIYDLPVVIINRMGDNESKTVARDGN